jgi:hypothetical protein
MLAGWRYSATIGEMKVVAVALSLLGLLALAAACGGKVPVADSARELDGRHCTSHQDCASGHCASSGRCG